MASENNDRMSPSHATILDVPNEILMKIFKEAENDKNLSLTCFRFYELINMTNEKNVSLKINHFSLINPMFDLDSHIKASHISLKIDYNCSSLSNITDKIELFLRDHGERVTELSYNWVNKPITVKLLELLPNLDEIELIGPFSFNSNEFEGFSKRVRKLTVDSTTNHSYLDVFEVEELEVKERTVITSPMLLPKHKNLKKLTLYDSKLTKPLRTLQLESFDCQLNSRHMRTIGNFLRSQKKLKELTLNANNEVWAIVCKCLEKLELLDVTFASELKAAEFSEISNLKSLKTLKIGFNKFKNVNKECFDELTKVKFVDLVSVDLYLCFELSTSDVEKLAASFASIKSLALYFGYGPSHQITSKVLEKFNRLESLTLWGENREGIKGNDKIFYYARNHKNPHLKSLHFRVDSYKLDSKLILKLIGDFPNLETIGFYDIVSTREHFELLMTGFKRIRKVENLWITNDEIFNAFLPHRRNLEEFHVDINSLDNPNEVLQGFSISFKSNFVETRTMRSSEQANEVDFYTYSHWQQLRTMMDSTKQVTHLTIDLSTLYVKKSGFIKYLTLIGERVTTLTLQQVPTSSVLKEILDAVPNIETLTLEYPYFFLEAEEGSDSVCYFSKKLKSFSLNYDYVKWFFDYAGAFQRLPCILKFADDSLLSFVAICHSNTVQIREEMLENFEKLTRNQGKLIKRSESRNERHYTIKLTAE